MINMSDIYTEMLVTKREESGPALVSMRPQAAAELGIITKAEAQKYEKQGISITASEKVIQEAKQKSPFGELKSDYEKTSQTRTTSGTVSVYSPKTQKTVITTEKETFVPDTKNKILYTTEEKYKDTSTAFKVKEILPSGQEQVVQYVVNYNPSMRNLPFDITDETPKVEMTTITNKNISAPPITEKILDDMMQYRFKAQQIISQPIPSLAWNFGTSWLGSEDPFAIKRLAYSAGAGLNIIPEDEAYRNIIEINARQLKLFDLAKSQPLVAVQETISGGGGLSLSTIGTSAAFGSIVGGLSRISPTVSKAATVSLGSVSIGLAAKDVYTKISGGDTVGAISEVGTFALMTPLAVSSFSEGFGKFAKQNENMISKSVIEERIQTFNQKEIGIKTYDFMENAGKTEYSGVIKSLKNEQMIKSFEALSGLKNVKSLNVAENIRSTEKINVFGKNLEIRRNLPTKNYATIGLKETGKVSILANVEITKGKMKLIDIGFVNKKPSGKEIKLEFWKGNMKGMDVKAIRMRDFDVRKSLALSREKMIDFGEIKALRVNEFQRGLNTKGNAFRQNFGSVTRQKSNTNILPPSLSEQTKIKPNTIVNLKIKPNTIVNLKIKPNLSTKEPETRQVIKTGEIQKGKQKTYQLQNILIKQSQKQDILPKQDTLPDQTQKQDLLQKQAQLQTQIQKQDLLQKQDTLPDQTQKQDLLQTQIPNIPITNIIISLSPPPASFRFSDISSAQLKPFKFSKIFRPTRTRQYKPSLFAISFNVRMPNLKGIGMEIQKSVIRPKVR